MVVSQNRGSLKYVFFSENWEHRLHQSVTEKKPPDISVSRWPSLGYGSADVSVIKTGARGGFEPLELSFRRTHFDLHAGSCRSKDFDRGSRVQPLGAGPKQRHPNKKSPSWDLTSLLGSWKYKNQPRRPQQNGRNGIVNRTNQERACLATAWCSYAFGMGIEIVIRKTQTILSVSLAAYHKWSNWLFSRLSFLVEFAVFSDSSTVIQQVHKTSSRSRRSSRASMTSTTN